MKPSVKISLWIIAALICAVLAFTIAEDREQPRGDFSPAETHFELRVGDKKVSACLALTDLERSRGLMRRQKLDQDEGMLFVYPREDSRSFWMKNVPINLSIGFFDSEGKLLEVHEMRAGSTVSTHSDSEHIRYCLEMSEGWFEKAGLTENGNVRGEIFLNLGDVEEAAATRGFRISNR